MIAQVKLDPARVVEVLDWCHGVHHLSLALAALGLAEERRGELYSRLRRLLKAGKSHDVIDELEVLAAGQLEDSAVWREIGYLTKHSEAGRLATTVSEAAVYRWAVVRSRVRSAA